MHVRDLSRRAIAGALRGTGIRVKVGPATARIRSDVGSLAEQIHKLYADYPLADQDSFADVDLRLIQSPGWRRLAAPQVHLVTDGMEWFAPFPADHALPMLEWGFNWHFAKRMHCFLMLHSAVVARNDRALLLPAWPGSGKSTLAAALSARGWRLLSDEFGLVQPETGDLLPFPRLIALKNESIRVMRDFAPDAVIGPVFAKTRKGDVAHFRPPAESVLRDRQPAQPRWIVFPKYEAGERAHFLPITQPAAFLKLAGNAFNYEVLGASAFEAVSRMIRGCDCRILRFATLDDAIMLIEEMAAETG